MESMALNASLIDILWSDIQGQRSISTSKPLLAHYTSVAVMEKIFTTGEIWLSNPLFMNDLEELRFGINHGASEFRSSIDIAGACGTTERHSQLIKVFDEEFQRFDNEHAIDTYVLCFSEHDRSDTDGLLSMWRGYGEQGKGVAIVFDSAKMPFVPGSPLIGGPVVYATTDQRKAWMRTRLKKIANLLAIIDRSDEALAEIARHWFKRLRMFALFTKHSGFSEEREWRLAYFSDLDKSDIYRPMIGYAITPRGIEPKLRLNVPAASGNIPSIDYLIDRILLGPSIATNLSAAAIRKMLQFSGKPKLADLINPSSIPFRS